MNAAIPLTQTQLSDFLLNVAIVRPVFIWGPPGSSQYRLAAIVKGEVGWPYNPADRDVLYFLSQSFRAQLIKELPTQRTALADGQKALVHRAKALIKDLAAISLEMAQMLVSGQGGDDGLPDWFMVEIVRDLPLCTSQYYRRCSRCREQGNLHQSSGWTA